MLRISILLYKLKEVTHSYVLLCFGTSKNCSYHHISATRCLLELRFESKCNISNGQVIYIEKSKLNVNYVT